MRKNKYENLREEQIEIQKSLIENGFKFLLRSASELEDNPDFSVSHFSTGIELLLKARLFFEHWSLIFEDPHSASWENLEKGKLKTIGATSLLKVLEQLTETPPNDEWKKSFDIVFLHRNKTLHFVPSVDKTKIAIEQSKAWFHLKSLLEERWMCVFENYSEEIVNVENAFVQNKTYLEEKFKSLENEINSLKRQEGVILRKCLMCGFKSDKITFELLSFSESKCLVCTQSASELISLSCGEWLSFLPDDYEGGFECECGEMHCRFEVGEALGVIGFKEAEIHCAECFNMEATISEKNGDYRCCSCGNEFGDVSTCDWCQTDWVSWSDNEFSYYTGCNNCEGHSGNQASKRYS